MFAIGLSITYGFYYIFVLLLVTEVELFMHGVTDRARSHGLSIKVAVKSNFHPCVRSELLKWIV